MDHEKKITPCPVCRSAMVLQYSKDDPHIMKALHSDNIQVPMRCCRCGINVTISVDPAKLEEEIDELSDLDE